MSSYRTPVPGRTAQSEPLALGMRHAPERSVRARPFRLSLGRRSLLLCAAGKLALHSRSPARSPLLEASDDHAARSPTRAPIRRHSCCDSIKRMPPTKKRKSTRKSVSTTKPLKTRRTAGKRGTGDRRKSLVLDVVQQLEQKLEAMPTQLRKAAKKTKKAASRSRVTAKVVNALGKGKTSVRKAAKRATTKKKTRRV